MLTIFLRLGDKGICRYKNITFILKGNVSLVLLSVQLMLFASRRKYLPRSISKEYLFKISTEDFNILLLFYADTWHPTMRMPMVPALPPTMTDTMTTTDLPREDPLLLLPPMGKLVPWCFTPAMKMSSET